MKIGDWKLAKNIALRNQELDIDELNYVVQTTIDRIIFLRMAEDRGIERYQTLYDLAKSEKENIYQRFMKYLKKLI